MKRNILSAMLYVASLLHAQISNVQQTTEKGRIIITYDLRGSAVDVYDIKITATNENGETILPRAIAGDLAAVTPGQERSIWWETSIDGLTPVGWKIILTAEPTFGIKWISVKGGPDRDFYISATEVTFDQFDKFCEATGYRKPSADFGRGQQPVINVNVDDAVAFCNWMSKETGTTVRLPEENEWEYAARGGNKSKGYIHSGSNIVDEVAWYSNNSGDRTHEVATKQPNELGIYDMSGNVWEWCGIWGAVRGGAWIGDAFDCGVSSRLALNPVDRHNDVGFRVLKKR